MVQEGSDCTPIADLHVAAPTKDPSAAPPPTKDPHVATAPTKDPPTAPPPSNKPPAAADLVTYPRAAPLVEDPHVVASPKEELLVAPLVEDPPVVAPHAAVPRVVPLVEDPHVSASPKEELRDARVLPTLEHVAFQHAYDILIAEYKKRDEKFFTSTSICNRKHGSGLTRLSMLGTSKHLILFLMQFSSSCRPTQSLF